MVPLGKRRRAREGAATFEGQLTVFGELLAAHPFATDRPGATHEMQVEYARALDAYEAASRAAPRDPEAARRRLDEGADALNRLNALLIGTAPDLVKSDLVKSDLVKSDLVKSDLVKSKAAKPRLSEPRPVRPGPSTPGAAESGPVGPESVEVRPAGAKERPATAGRQVTSGKPRLRERYTTGQLVKRAGITAGAVYVLAVWILGSFVMAFTALMGINVGLGFGVAGGAFTVMALDTIWGAMRGGLVTAEYTHTTKKPYVRSGEAGWEQHYRYVDGDGQEFTCKRDARSPSLAPLPTRRLLLLKGGRMSKTTLGTFWTPLLSLLALMVTVPAFLVGIGVFFAAAPGVLIAALTGHGWTAH